MVYKGWEQDPSGSLSLSYSLPIRHFAVSVSQCDAARQDDLISAALKDEENKVEGGYPYTLLWKHFLQSFLGR